MKTMKAIPHFLLAGALLLGAACSTSNTSRDAVSSTPATTTTPAAGADMAATGDTGAGSVAAADVPAGEIVVFMSTFPTMTDPVFLINVASSNMLEIQAGQMAAQQATSPDVKQYAQLMVTHNTQTTQEVKTLAVPLNVTLPTNLLPVHQAMADRMLNKTGKAFDEAYMDLMETAHKLDIAMFEVKSKNAETPTVKSFATRILPVLRSNKALADKLEDKVD
ncbi:DUF4142 domain-containing protein [Hymenobacter sp. BT683]|uniref:DUF4142 domain-containing protein n=1 Tax=Hymenobacter jeongseonensis TaxID=2791027 RepID=A0ABS0IF71_9BACT|nr:DUF4142 domain-containing protein [Hymenobacter jeongseonensis]MBF9237006.1 DUF4142 domain-containing protein [Hymenobacter jeongseonensis]